LTTGAASYAGIGLRKALALTSEGAFSHNSLPYLRSDTTQSAPGRRDSGALSGRLPTMIPDVPERGA